MLPSTSRFLKAIETSLNLACCCPLQQGEALEGLSRHLKNKNTTKKKVSRTQALILHLRDYIQNTGSVPRDQSWPVFPPTALPSPLDSQGKADLGEPSKTPCNISRLEEGDC